MFTDDEQWVAEQVRRLPFDMRSATIDRYENVYRETYLSTVGSDIQKIQNARTTANTRLRKYIDRLLA